MFRLWDASLALSAPFHSSAGYLLIDCEPEETQNSLLTCPTFLSAKVVDLDPCLSKKPLEEKPSQPYSARESLSEVQSLSSFQSESCDDNGEYPGDVLWLLGNVVHVHGVV